VFQYERQYTPNEINI